MQSSTSRIVQVPKTHIYWEVCINYFPKIDPFKAANAKARRALLKVINGGKSNGMQ